jgi:transposase
MFYVASLLRYAMLGHTSLRSVCLKEWNPPLESKYAIRLLVILNRESGKTLESIAEFLAISLSSVERYIKRFNNEGMKSLLKNKTRKPGKTPASEEKKNEIWAHRERCANSMYRET